MERSSSPPQILNTEFMLMITVPKAGSLGFYPVAVSNPRLPCICQDSESSCRERAYLPDHKDGCTLWGKPSNSQPWAQFGSCKRFRIIGMVISSGTNSPRDIARALDPGLLGAEPPEPVAKTPHPPQPARVTAIPAPSSRRPLVWALPASARA